MAAKPRRKPKPDNDPRFNLGIDEVKLIDLYRRMPSCDKRGVVNALVQINQEYGAGERSRDTPESGSPIG